MEPGHGTNKASKSASDEEEDFISTMPENVITNILNRLPLKNAVGTSILTRNWRFKWTLLTQLIFDYDFFDYLPIEEDEDFDWKIIISRLVIYLQGPITKFILYVPETPKPDVRNINHLVLFLFRKGIKDLTLINHPWALTELELPTHLFSCLELKHLKLRKCSFHTPPTFSGFPNLLSLDLDHVTGDSVEFITKCPLLEILMIRDFKLHIGKVKLAEIAKLINLKMLYVPLYMFGDLAFTSSTIFQLGRYLPKLQELTLDFHKCKISEEGGVRKWVCTAFPCLKTLSLYNIEMSSSIMLSCAIEMIRDSTNLQTLTITVDDDDDDDVTLPPPPQTLTSSEVDYNTLGQLQLRYVEVVCLGLENEVRLIKHLLASSPFLKKMVINTYMIFDGKMELTKKLLKLHRASPTVDVKVSDSRSFLSFPSVFDN